MSILADIVASKRRELAAAIAERPLEAVREHALNALRTKRAAGVARDFAAALRRPDELAVIAEFKRRSPSKGSINPDADVAEVARGYHAAGAAAMSVLTDGPFFGGDLEDLRAARAAAPALPLLRKDFTLEPYQVFEAAGAGADAILLIVRILDDAALRSLLELADELGLAALVEAHDAAEVDRAVAAGARIIGVNARDLASFAVSLDTVVALRERIPAECIAVAESGIHTPDDAARVRAAGYDAVLVGEALMRAADGAALLQSLRQAGR